MKKTFEIAHSEKKCPIYDTSCPYCDSNGYCHITNPMRECDDYFAYYGEEGDDDYFNVLKLSPKI